LSNLSVHHANGRSIDRLCSSLSNGGLVMMKPDFSKMTRQEL